MSVKIRKEKVIDCGDWDELVTETYKRPYCLQQQDGCMDRGAVHLTIPEDEPEDFENESIPEVINDTQ